MPNLDPKVVNEPRNIETYEYSRDEIVSIVLRSPELLKTIKENAGGGGSADTRTNVQKLQALKTLLLTLDGNDPAAFDETFEFNWITTEEINSVIPTEENMNPEILFSSETNYLANAANLYCSCDYITVLVDTSEEGKVNKECSIRDGIAFAIQAEEGMPSDFQRITFDGIPLEQGVSYSFRIHVKFTPAVE